MVRARLARLSADRKCGWSASTSAAIRKLGNANTSANPFTADCGPHRPTSTACSRSATSGAISARPSKPSTSISITGSTSVPGRACEPRASATTRDSSPGTSGPDSAQDRSGNSRQQISRRLTAICSIGSCPHARFVAFDNRHRDRGVRAAAVHPGGIQTELDRHLDPSHVRKTIEQMNQRLAAEGKAPFQLRTIPQGAATSVWTAVVAPADEIGGHYCENCHVGNIVPDNVPITAISEGVRGYALDANNAEALWKKSEELVGESF